ncbi:NAD(P)/FAD-dependent oxidoreductase [Desertihabitans aurantiacus]|uniref:NAD(P)/FAD-dependent oxidoreductase n=1 Tax=Desertihabitans aurantiacus TaxID=2282477 RepID=UPI000DF7A868|nr:NAD(P)/FAD-dependent oxidoreductase [Desertihabitans aurantiacus]
MSTGPHVVVVGAGFAGVAAVRRLTKLGCRVTLVDRHPYNTFQPLLYQVATGGLNPGDVTYSLRALAAKQHRRLARFRRAMVTGIDREKRQVIVDDGPPIDYDYVVLANGVTTNHFGIPGAAHYSHSLYTRKQAIEVRDTIFGAMERLAANPEEAERGFTVIVVGGGPTGVEMAGSLAEMRTYGVPVVYPELKPENVRVVLVEMMDELLGPFEADLRAYTRKELEERGVEVRTGTAIAEVRADSVDLKGGETMQADLVIWAAGIGGYSFVKEWGLETGRGGRILLEDTLLAKGEERIFVAGDCGMVESGPLPQLAPVAMQQGKHAADNVVALAKGEPMKAFNYVDKGTMATIGRNDAVVELRGGIKFKGFIAWAAWVALHIYMLLGGRNRAQAFISLMTRYLTFPRNSVAIVGDVADTPGRKEFIASLAKAREKSAGEVDASDLPEQGTAQENTETPAPEVSRA